MGWGTQGQVLQGDWNWGRDLDWGGGGVGEGLMADCQRLKSVKAHTYVKSYLIFVTNATIYSCKNFLAGVNFYIFNAKNWHFRQILREKVAFFLQI